MSTLRMVCLVIWVLAAASNADACTIFATHSGTLPIAGKIRDTLNHHNQELRIVSPDYSLGETESYLGLFAVDGSEAITFSPLKMGVNEKGVFVGFATVSSVPSQIRRSLPFFKDLSHHLLTRAQSARETYEMLQKESSPLGLRILLIADAREAFLLENGPDSGSLALLREPIATNHFQSRSLRHLNTASIEDSIHRLELAKNRLPFLDFLPADDASEIIRSLWVAPTTKKSTFTRSDFIVFYPPGKSPFVKVTIENDGKVSQSQLELNTLFETKTCSNHLLTAQIGTKSIDLIGGSSK